MMAAIIAKTAVVTTSKYVPTNAKMQIYADPTVNGAMHNVVIVNRRKLPASLSSYIPTDP